MQKIKMKRIQLFDVQLNNQTFIKHLSIAISNECSIFSDEDFIEFTAMN